LEAPPKKQKITEDIVLAPIDTNTNMVNEAPVETIEKKPRKQTDIKDLKPTVHIKEGKDVDAIARRFILSSENEEDPDVKTYITAVGMRRYNSLKGGKVEVSQKKVGYNTKLRAEFYESKRKKIPDLEEVFFYDKRYLESIYTAIVKRLSTKRRTAATMKPLSIQDLSEKSPTLFWNIYFHFDKDIAKGVVELHKTSVEELKE